MRLALPLLLLAFLAGCVDPAIPPAPPAQPQAVEEPEAWPSFDLLVFHPTDPRAGQAALVRASVTPPGFDRPPWCLFLVGPDGVQGGGVGGSMPMSERDTYQYECELPSSQRNDFLAVLLVGHDGRSWVRSDLHVLRTPDGPGAGRPGVRIDALDVLEAGENLTLRLRVSPAPLANPLAPLVTGAVETHRFPRDHEAYLGLGVRLQAGGEVGALEGTYPRVYPHEGEGVDARARAQDERDPFVEAASDPDFVALAFAYAYDANGAYDVSGLVEIAHGACARERCMRT